MEIHSKSDAHSNIPVDCRYHFDSNELMLQCSVIMMLIEAIMENTPIDTYSSLGNA
jgi:hypothetical protein